ncbi:MAG: glycerophosphodiester phosphodiesterase [Vampirovibrio sp.]|nr:glycerophosphodiester phosphodiesterase [Vampirovibrio sp.]
MTITKVQPIIGGHRGVGCTDHVFYAKCRNISALPVENTVASIKDAFVKGADYVETDAVMSGDKVVFALHNVVPGDHFFKHPFFLRPDNADGSRKLLNLMPFKDIALLKTGRLQTGSVSTLAEVLGTVAAKDPKTADWGINVEIKGVQGSGQPYEVNDYLTQLAETVKAGDVPVRRVLFSSFSLENLIRMSYLLPNAKYGMLFAEENKPRGIYTDHQDDPTYQYLPFDEKHIELVLAEWRARASARARLGYLHPEVRTVTPEMVGVAAKNGLGVNTWGLFEELTTDRKQQYRELAALCEEKGVKLTMITDYVGEMKTALSLSGVQH